MEQLRNLMEMERPLPSLHPVVWGLHTQYRQSSSSAEKAYTIQEAHEESGIPIDVDDAWKWLKSNPKWSKHYKVEAYV